MPASEPSSAFRRVDGVAEYRFTNAARSDLRCIGQYTLDNWDLRQYDEYIGGLETYCQRLADMPVLGRPYRRPPYQWSRYVSHVVYFRRKDDGDIVVVRILDKKMKPELHFDPSTDDDFDEDA